MRTDPAWAARDPGKTIGREKHEGRPADRTAFDLVELIGIEPTTSSLRTRRSPS